MARPGGVWRLALGVVAFVVFSSGNVALVGLPFAGLLLAAGPSSARDWVLVVVAFLLGALGVLSPASHSQLDGVVSAYIVLVSVSFVSIALLQPASFLRMGLRATLWATAAVVGLSWLVWGGLPVAVLQWEATREAGRAAWMVVERLHQAVTLVDPVVRVESATLPAMLWLETLAGLALAWQLHVRLARRPLGEPLRPFREFRFGDHWIWAVVGALMVWVLPALAGLRGAALNVSVVLAALYLLRGAAVVTAFAATTGVSAIALVVSAVAAVALVVPLLVLLPGLCTLGVTDTWLQFRHRLAGRSPHTRG